MLFSVCCQGTAGNDRGKMLCMLSAIAKYSVDGTEPSDR